MPGTRKLGRTTDHRMSMLRGQVTLLLDNGSIRTTVTRAKEIRSLTDKMITLGKTNTLASKRQALAFITKEDVVKKLFDTIAPSLSDRNGGYTRIYRLGPRRGDGAEMALIELVNLVKEDKKSGKDAKAAAKKPAAKKAAETCKTNSNLGIIGTKVTIGAHAYRDTISKYNSFLNIFEHPCPAFVPLIEEGIIDNEIMDLTIRYYMDSFVRDNKLDTVILGCTHYPLIKENITRLYPHLTVINPSSIVVSRIHHVLEDNDMLAEDSEFTNVFYASDLSENFLNMIDHIFADEEEDKKVKFLNFDFEKDNMK